MFSFPACKEAPLRLNQSWSHLQATCTLIHTGVCRWFESASATADFAKNSPRCPWDSCPFQPKALRQRCQEMPALPAITMKRRVGLMPSTPSIPKWNRRYRGPSVRQASQATRHAEAFAWPQAPPTSTAGSVELGCHPSGQSHADLSHQGTPHLQPQSSFATF